MNKKGYTLIEIIVCVVIIALIGVSSIFIILNNKDDEVPKEDMEELNNSIRIITDLYESKGNLKGYYYSEEDINSYKAYFCFSKDTLINEGLIEENNEFIKNMKDNEYIKVIRDELGSYSIDIASSEDCNYLKSEIDNRDISNTEPKVVDKLSQEENGYYLSQQLIQNSEETNKYQYKIDFKFNTGKLNDTSFRPNIYTVFIIDGSGSMCSSSSDSTCKTNNSRFQQAIDASKSLSKELVSVNKNSNSFTNYVAAISFDDSIDMNIGFQTTKLVNSDFYFGNGSTYYYNALEAAYSKIKDIPKDKNRFFIIFLTDGVNNGGDYSTPLNQIKTFLKPPGSEIEYGKLITVGFNYNNTTLSSISSPNCKGDGTDCYYQASSTNIGNVFTNFLSVIEKEVMCSTFKKAKVTIKLSDNFEFSDGTKEKIIGSEEYIELECNTSDLTSVLQTQSILNNELYNLKFNQPDVNSLDVGTYEFSIIDYMSIEFFDGDNKLIDTIDYKNEDFPTVSMNIDKISVVN